MVRPHLPPSFWQDDQADMGKRNGEDGWTNGADKGIFYFISLFGSDDRWAERVSEWVSEWASTSERLKWEAQNLNSDKKGRHFIARSSSWIQVDRLSPVVEIQDRSAHRFPIAKMIRTQQLNRFPLLRQSFCKCLKHICGCREGRLFCGINICLSGIRRRRRWKKNAAAAAWCFKIVWKGGVDRRVPSPFPPSALSPSLRTFSVSKQD